MVSSRSSSIKFMLSLIEVGEKKGRTYDSYLALRKRRQT